MVVSSGEKNIRKLVNRVDGKSVIVIHLGIRLGILSEFAYHIAENLSDLENILGSCACNLIGHGDVDRECGIYGKLSVNRLGPVDLYHVSLTAADADDEGLQESVARNPDEHILADLLRNHVCLKKFVICGSKEYGVEHGLFIIVDNLNGVGYGKTGNVIGNGKALALFYKYGAFSANNLVAVLGDVVIVADGKGRDEIAVGKRNRNGKAHGLVSRADGPGDILGDARVEFSGQFDRPDCNLVVSLL